MDLIDKIRECKKCEAGSYAPKILDFYDFERIPSEMFPNCAETNDIGKASNCDIITQWHVNSDANLDSGKGIPRG